MPHGTIDGEPYNVPDGWAIVSVEQRRRADAALNLLSDLDRSPHGRHQGDVESQDPTGRSQGNPMLRVGQVVGYTIDGRRIIVPERRGDPDAWIEPRDPAAPPRERLCSPDANPTEPNTEDR